ncbi:hypothetical protein LPJ66_009118, partial [Kickxella alabastrina]
MRDQARLVIEGRRAGVARVPGGCPADVVDQRDRAVKVQPRVLADPADVELELPAHQRPALLGRRAHLGPEQRARGHVGVVVPVGPRVVLAVAGLDVRVGLALLLQRLPRLAGLGVVDDVEAVVQAVVRADLEVLLLAHVLAQHGRRRKGLFAVQALQRGQLALEDGQEGLDVDQVVGQPDVEVVLAVRVAEDVLARVARVLAEQALARPLRHALPLGRLRGQHRVERRALDAVADQLVGLAGVRADDAHAVVARRHAVQKRRRGRPRVDVRLQHQRHVVELAEGHAVGVAQVAGGLGLAAQRRAAGAQGAVQGQRHGVEVRRLVLRVLGLVGRHVKVGVVDRVERLLLLRVVVARLEELAQLVVAPRAAALAHVHLELVGGLQAEPWRRGRCGGRAGAGGRWRARAAARGGRPGRAPAARGCGRGVVAAPGAGPAAGAEPGLAAAGAGA